MIVTECAQAVILHQEGSSYRRIGDRLGVANTSVSRVVKRYRETDEHTRRTEQGRNRITTRYLRLSALRKRCYTHGIQVRLIRQRPTEDDLTPRIALRGPALTVNHNKTMLNFAMEHINWEKTEW